MKYFILILIFTILYSKDYERLIKEEHKKVDEITISMKWRNLINIAQIHYDYPHDYYGHITQDSVRTEINNSLNNMKKILRDHISKK
jgi:uncharacterized protein YvpB